MLPFPLVCSDMAVTIVAVADSNSCLKWNAALLRQVPDDWERSLVILAGPLLPSDDQFEVALHAGLPAVLDLAALSVRLRELQPDIVLLSLSGPLITVVVRAIIAATDRRPIIVTGLPGISIPATRIAITDRAKADLFVLHSHREVREFIALADPIHTRLRFALTTFPFLPKRAPGQRADGDVIFAAQATVPAARADRLVLLGWLADAARRHPYRRVVINDHESRFEKGRGYGGYADLLSELFQPPPSNLVVAVASMADHLGTAAALVTVSSTAAIEAVALDVPVLILGEFAATDSVFVGSGLIGGQADLVAGRFRHANAGWIFDNYFHNEEDNDWLDQLDWLLARRRPGEQFEDVPRRAASSLFSVWRMLRRAHR